jgi:hypothetical protein
MKLKKLLEHIDETHPSSRVNSADKCDKASATGGAATESIKKVRLRLVDSKGYVNEPVVKSDELISDNLPMDLSRTGDSKLSRGADSERLSTAQNSAVSLSSVGNVIDPAHVSEESEVAGETVGATEKSELGLPSTHPSEIKGMVPVYVG